MPPGAISPNFRPRSLSDAVRLLQVATPARSRNPGSAASAQCPKAARATSIAFALGRPCYRCQPRMDIGRHSLGHFIIAWQFARYCRFVAATFLPSAGLLAFGHLFLVYFRPSPKIDCPPGRRIAPKAVPNQTVLQEAVVDTAAIKVEPRF